MYKIKCIFIYLFLQVSVLSAPMDMCHVPALVTVGARTKGIYLIPCNWSYRWFCATM